ncbi:MAG: hypothetical protein EAZ42_06800 [Verrucomicrobia bacterium]|nr:MAG: hypothetical protein EAZ42_06800 [Verrucomicrobiota bacterium]
MIVRGCSDTGIDIDSDMDGIGDQWELAYAGNLTTFSAANDQDKDGRTDLQEYLAFTSPIVVDREFNLEFLSFTHSSGQGQSQLRWLSKPNRRYDVEQSSTLMVGSWSPSAGSSNLSGTGGLITRTITNPYSGGKLFFRVEAGIGDR